MTKVRIKPRILDVVEDDGMWLDQSTLTYYSKEDVEEVDLFPDLEEAADSAAIKAFPEKKAYSTVVDRVVDYNAIDRKNYRDGFIAGAEWGADHLRDSTKMADKGLDEAATKFAYSEGYQDPEYYNIVDAFKTGAKWQEKRDEETIKTAEDHAFLAGADWQEEQILKDAMEGEVHPDDCEIWVNLIEYGYKFNDGDKVHIIVLPK